ncbi:hypothetical protein Aple_012930 [Acrocarpospora pleiomorpha]|uniref:DUF4286 family protein n=1 Tax=Acrocarpospora pleiomorpha TaxID=90975 RepID=A0A5M3XJX0_9ACTN|nr:DUF4286 family protein [Acrocarpospora pleiomorpha]GES18398.1 hypothetical protein Aple_012930 [Acrocarpospora pleiomorpha]
MAGVIVVFTCAVEGKDAEFNEWYDNVHLPELLELPSIRSAKRYRLNEATNSSVKQRYLTVYDVTDPGQAAKEMAEAVQNGMLISPALDRASGLQGYFDELASS